MHKLKCYILFTLLLAAGTLFARSAGDTLNCGKPFCCCTDDPTPAGVMISHVHEKNEWMVSYKYMNMYMNGVLSGTKQIDKNELFVNYLMAPEKMQMDMHMIMAMYGITDNLTLMTMFNYQATSMDMAMFVAGGGHNHNGATGNRTGHAMRTSGIGDIKLHAIYALINNGNKQLLISTGINIPTGNIELKGAGNDMMYPNQHLPYSMQLGSGSFELMPGINFMSQRGAITFSSQLSSTLRTGYNRIGYKLGNETSLNTWLAWQWNGYISSSIRIEGVISDRISGYDPALYYYNEPSSNPYNYGGQKMNCYIGSLFHFKKACMKKSRLAIEYGIPVYQYLNGLQMELKSTLYASWSITF